MDKNAVMRRFSCREYSETPLSRKTLSIIGEAIGLLKPLFEDISVSFSLYDKSEIDSVVSGKLVKAPHYIVVKSEKKSFYLENVGFLAEQLVLYLTQMNIGTCWCGMGREVSGKEDGKEYCITVACGYPGEGVRFREDASLVKRKSLKTLVYGEVNPSSEEYLEAARLAPSALNHQPVRYLVQGDEISIFRNPSAIGYLDKLRCIDTGIAAANIYWTAMCEGRDLSFYRKGNTELSGKSVYFLSCNISD